MKKTIENRLSRLRKSLSDKNVDTFMVLIEENRRYLSGFTAQDTQFDESAGVLFITDTKLILATDSRYELQAGSESPLYDIVCYKKGLDKELSNILRTLKTKKLSFESIRMSYMQYKKISRQLKSDNLRVELVPTDNIVENLRVIKEESEIKEIKKALSIAESIFTKFISILKPGMTEKESAWIIEKEMHEAGADSLSFPSIAASGPNSALPHAIPGNRKLKAHEPILFDWGARLNGYSSDISRTLVLGCPDDTFKRVYKTVLDAQAMAIDAIKPGISGKSIDKIARDHIEKMGFKGKFGHGLGHGTGLAVHERPKLSPLKDTKLEPQMVFTVEPGVYLPGWGGVRLENMVVVRENGAEVLNRTDPAIFMEGINIK